ncbi:MAG: hypothetical protein WBG41_02290, partial [Acidimicrobiales bacterium]
MNYSNPSTGTVPSSSSGPLKAEDSALGRLAGWCYDHRRRVLLLWIGAIIVITVVAQSMGSRF